MRKAECKAYRRLLDRSVFGEDALERRWVERLIRLDGRLHLVSDYARERSSAVAGHIAAKANDVSERRVPEEESRCECSAGLVDRHEVTCGIVCELGLHMQQH